MVCVKGPFPQILSCALFRSLFLLFPVCHWDVGKGGMGDIFRGRRAAREGGSGGPKRGAAQHSPSAPVS